MYDDIARVDQHPVAAIFSLDRKHRLSGFFQRIGDIVGKGGDMALRAATCDKHAIRKAALGCKIEHGDILGLVILQRVGDEGALFIEP